MSKMPAVPYAVLRAHFPTKANVDKAALYTLIGHPEKIPDHSWDNTCAIRVSVALIGVGFPISPGFLTIETGPHKGKRIESRQKVLSELLRSRWGEPRKFKSGPEARKALAGQRGVISFFHLYGIGDAQGHIDLVSPDNWNDAACADDCYWQSAEVWFWPLR